MSVGLDRDGRRDGRKAKAGSDLPTRVISAVVLAVFALIGALLGGWVAAIVLGIVMAIVHLEWTSLTDKSPWPSAVFTVGLVVALAMMTLGYVEGSLMIVALAIAAAAATISVWRPLGVLYAAVLGVGLLLIILSPTFGLPAILTVLVTVWATDTGAFVAGRTIGGARLWPAVSPNKTWSGAIGGLLAGIVFGTLVAAWLAVPVTAGLVVVVAALALAAEAGDLFESWVKRRFGAKDSSALVPGHGGLMDRVDGLVFASGLAVLIGWLHQTPSLAQGVLLW